MIKNKTAQRLAHKHHNGVASSGLVSLARQGIYFIQYHLKYLQEIEWALWPDYKLRPGTLSKQSDKELNGLKEWVISQGEAKGIFTEWEKNEQYGYMVPYIKDDVPDKLANEIEVISYMK